MTALETTRNFKVKGTALRNLIKFLNAKLGSETYNEIHQNMGLQLPSVILTSSWYSTEEYKKLIEGGSNLMGININEFMIAAGRFTLEVDLHGIYKFFMKAVQPHVLLAKTATIGKTYTNVIEIEIISSQPGEFDAWYTCNVNDWEWAIAGSEGAQIGMLEVVGCTVERWKILEKEYFQRDGLDFVMGQVIVRYHKKSKS